MVARFSPEKAGLRQPRLAEMVASELRSAIVRGDLREGESLPTQDDLCAQFEVGKVAVREALRILENEGLATVRRGNTGGATVHVPGARGAGRMLAMVMAANSVPAGELAVALQEMEATCASMCAERADRAATIVPHLREIVRRSAVAGEDPVSFTLLSREFHQAIVERCGNQAMAVVVGALEAIWSRTAEGWARLAEDAETYPDLEARRESLRVHGRIVSLIDDGAADEVARLTKEHLRTAQRYSLGSDPDRPVTVEEFG